MSSAWIQRKLVGVPCAISPVDQARESFQMARANLGQMTQVHIPTPIRNTAQLRDTTMSSKYSSPYRRTLSQTSQDP